MQWWFLKIRKRHKELVTRAYVVPTIKEETHEVVEIS